MRDAGNNSLLICYIFTRLLFKASLEQLIDLDSLTGLEVESELTKSGGVI